MPGLVSRLDEIAEKLDRLAARGVAFSVFGASTHKYSLRSPISEQALSDFERRMGCELPAEYRLFVTRVGHGGAGPDYGLFPLDDRDSEDITDYDLIKKPFRWTGAFNPYDWEDPCGQEDVWCDDEAEEGEQPQVILGVPGALYICHHGCAMRSFLVVRGQCQGEVWRDLQSDDEGVVPQCDASGRHLSFFGWYEKWLDESLAFKPNPRTAWY